MTSYLFIYWVAPIMAFASTTDSAESDKSMTLFSFERNAEVSRWYPINDGVMGGVSDGRLEHTADGALRFFGVVSLENNGGFASVRSRPAVMDLSRYTGVLIRVRGDGKRYALNLETDFQIRAGSYRCKFATEPAKWVELYFPFSDFQATSFGVKLDRAPSLNTKEIRSLGLLISDKQAGPFSLDVEWIRAVAKPPSPAKE